MFLQYVVVVQLRRYRTYCRLLQYKIAAFPEIEPSLAEIAIGEVDEPILSSLPSNFNDQTNNPVTLSTEAEGTERVSRSGSAYAFRRSTLERYAGKSSPALPPSPSHIVRVTPNLSDKS